MIIATASLESNGSYSQGKYIDGAEFPKKPKEGHDAYEQRTWRERCHSDDQGNIEIPAMAFKNCIAEVSKYLGEKIPGKNMATYSKHFTAGLLVLENLVLPIKKDTVPGEWLFVPSNGKKGGGSRVRKCFPLIKSWKGDVVFHVLDSTITREVFERHLKEAGNFIGIGRFRPINGGIYGRFSVKKLQWQQLD